MDYLTRRFWPYALLAILLAMMQYKLWFGQGNWQQVEDLRAQVQAQKMENHKLLLRNNALVAEVKDLKSGVDAVEERARNEMGMVKPGETFYRVVDPEKKINMDAPVAEPKP